MSNGNRARLLDRVKAALGSRRESLASPEFEPLTEAPPQDLAKLFGSELQAADGHFVEARSLAEMHAYLDLLIASRSIRAAAISDAPLLRSLALPEWLAGRLESAVVARGGGPASVGTNVGELARADVGISSCTFAIARTGTLLISVGAERNRLISLLPMTYVAVFTLRQLVPDLRMALSQLQACEDLNPCITLITGPSRTGDIEMTLSTGVHGPGDVHAILLNL